MAFASPAPQASAKKKANTPNKELVVKVNTSKGFVTLGRIGLYDESALHNAVSQLTQEQLAKMFASAQLEIIDYSRDDEDKIALVL